MNDLRRRSIIMLGAAGALLVGIRSPSVIAQSAVVADEAARNKETLTTAYRLWHESKGESVEHWMSIADDNIAFGSLAEGSPAAPLTAPVRSKEELRRYLRGLRENWEMIHFTVSYFIAEGDRVAMVGRTAWRNRKTNRTIETPKVDVWRFRNGRAVEVYEYYDTAGVVAAAS